MIFSNEKGEVGERGYGKRRKGQKGVEKSDVETRWCKVEVVAKKKEREREEGKKE